MTRPSYWKIGKAIKRFCNYYLDGTRVELIPPLGQMKEKETLAMPPKMVEALTEHVVARLRSFRPLQERCAEAGTPEKLAKYLGKCNLVELRQL